MDTRRILIIDDEAGLTRMVKLILEKTGRYEVHEVNDPLQALDKARETKPNLILLDIVMPQLDGGEVLSRLKADDELKSIPVVFLTATMTQEGVDARSGMIGGYPFITKPVDGKQLARTIENNLK